MEKYYIRIVEIVGSIPTGSTMTPKQLGILGEKIATTYLKKKGYQILFQNYSPHHLSGPKRGEIDIVAKKGDAISFTEVKTLKTCGNSGIRDSPISPEEKIDFSKKRKIVKMAESWLIEKKIPLDSKWQVDVISVRIDLENKKAKILHFYNV